MVCPFKKKREKTQLESYTMENFAYKVNNTCNFMRWYEPPPPIGTPIPPPFLPKWGRGWGQGIPIRTEKPNEFLPNNFIKILLKNYNYVFTCLLLLSTYYLNIKKENKKNVHQLQNLRLGFQRIIMFIYIFTHIFKI